MIIRLGGGGKRWPGITTVLVHIGSGGVGGFSRITIGGGTHA